MKDYSKKLTNEQRTVKAFTDPLNRIIEKLTDGNMKRKEKDKYVIIDLRNMDYMKNENGKINYYDTEEEAIEACNKALEINPKLPIAYNRVTIQYV